MSDTERYSTALKVQNLFNRQTAYSASTIPSKEAVEELIDRKMEFIDNRLHQSFHLSRTIHKQRLSVDLESRYLFTGLRIPLPFIDIITPLSASAGDTLSVWDGTQEVDYIADKTEGRNDDYFFIPEAGLLFVKAQQYKVRDWSITISFRYNSGGRTQLNDADGINTTDTAITVDSTLGFPQQGWLRIGSEDVRYNAKTNTAFTAIERGAYNTTAASHSDDAVIFWCPKDIEEACTKLAAIDLTTSNDYSTSGTAIPEIGSSQVILPDKIGIWKKDVAAIFKRYLPRGMRVV